MDGDKERAVGSSGSKLAEVLNRLKGFRLKVRTLNYGLRPPDFLQTFSLNPFSLFSTFADSGPEDPTALSLSPSTWPPAPP